MGSSRGRQHGHSQRKHKANRLVGMWTMMCISHDVLQCSFVCVKGIVWFGCMRYLLIVSVLHMLTTLYLAIFCEEKKTLLSMQSGDGSQQFAALLPLIWSELTMINGM